MGLTDFGMEGNLVSSYLRTKFSSTLNEAAADQRIPSLIRRRFQSIEGHINRINQNSDTMVDVLYDLMDALSECTIFADEAASKKGFNFLPFVTLINIMRRATLINIMRFRLDKIEKDLKDIRLNQVQDRSAEASAKGVVIQHAYSDPSPIVGFEPQVGEIEELLMPMESLADDAIQEEGKRFKSIGIVGMCGSGKTALAQKVFSSHRVEKSFFPRIWVCLSEMLFENKGSDLRKRVLNHILSEIGHDASDLEYGDYSVDKLQEKLSLRLMGKRYLIVLDDAWRMEEWFSDLGCTGQPGLESFTHGLPKGSGGAVIVTSRGENFIRRMVGEKHVIRPHLPYDFCWKIFSEAVRQQDKIPPHHSKLIQMKESVINNCQGLPLAAKTLAYVLSDLLSDESPH